MAKSSYEISYPGELWEAERDRLSQRREIPSDGDKHPDTVGFALSGGGIRSATFSLGIFQALARARLLRKIDYLSSVSGGGYFASFLGRLFVRDELEDVEGVDDVEAVLQGKRHPEILRYLRANGRYLAPGGSGDLLLGSAVLLRNWVAIQVVLMISLVTVFLAAHAIRLSVEVAEVSWYERWSGGLQGITGQLWLSPWLVVPISLFVLLAVPLGWAYWLVEKGNRIHPLAGVVVAILVGGGIVVDSLERFQGRGFFEGPGFLWAGVVLVVVGVLTLVVRLVTRLRSSGDDGIAPELQERNWLSRGLKSALVGTAVFLVFAVLDSAGLTLYQGFLGQSPGWLGGLAGGVGAAVALAPRVLVKFLLPAGEARPRLPAKVLASLAALLVAGLFALLAGIASHAVVWRFDFAKEAPVWSTPERVRAPLVEGSATDRDFGIDLVLEQPVESRVVSGPITFADRDFAWIALGVGTLLSLLFGVTTTFLNRSSHHALYSARLTRAYLGASNPERWSNPLNRPFPGDDITLDDYWPPATAATGGVDPDAGRSGGGTPFEKGAPLHLINVTINETVDGRYGTQVQDRKGVGMVLGPAGMSAGVRHHVVLDWRRAHAAGGGPWSGAERPEAVRHVLPDGSGYRVFDYPDRGFDGERLSLGKWVAISGAAFSTGTGYRTSLGMSLLAGLANVRLGYWWSPGGTRDGSALAERARGWLRNSLFHLFPVQSYLLLELVARFPGTARSRWYLSDGGHFENLGAYELIRRRLPSIVVIDAEADPDYTYHGLADLMRKARIDFGAEIEFLDESELDDEVHPDVRRYFGTLEQLRRGDWAEVPVNRLDSEQRFRRSDRLVGADPRRFSLAHAALARVTYEDPQGESWFVYIKPTLLGSEPADLVEYHENHPSFPHETTIDQFFEEAQWESYRKLGLEIGSRVFARTPAGPWPSGNPVAPVPGTPADGESP